MKKKPDEAEQEGPPEPPVKFSKIFFESYAEINKMLQQNIMPKVRGIAYTASCLPHSPSYLLVSTCCLGCPDK